MEHPLPPAAAAQLAEPPLAACRSLPAAACGADRAPGLNVLYNKAEWLVVEGSMLTLDGTQCNKIGVGYA